MKIVGPPAPGVKCDRRGCFAEFWFGDLEAPCKYNDVLTEAGWGIFKTQHLCPEHAF